MDYHLSMATSRRRRGGEVHPLRSLLVHRLREASKAVLRMRMSSNIATCRQYQIYCEPCGKWVDAIGAGEQFDCPRCGGVYVLEYAVYSRIGSAERVAK